MAHELRGPRCHRRFFLRASVVALVALLATGCDHLLETCSACGGTGSRFRDPSQCHNCKGRGTFGGKPCPDCAIPVGTRYPCRACKSSGKQPGNAGVLASVLHAINALAIFLLGGLGVFLLCKRRVSLPRSRLLYRAMGIVLGVLALVAAATVAAIGLLWFAFDFVGGIGIEGRSGGETAGEAIHRLKYGIAGTIVAGTYLLVGGLCALLGSRPKNPQVTGVGS